MFHHDAKEWLSKVDEDMVAEVVSVPYGFEISSAEIPDCVKDLLTVFKDQPNRDKALVGSFLYGLYLGVLLSENFYFLDD